MDVKPTAALEQMLVAMTSIPVAQLHDAELRDVLITAESVRNACEALQGRLMVEMVERAHRADVADVTNQPLRTPMVVPTGGREEFVADEIAVHLHCTRVAASHRLDTALTAHHHLPLALAWKAGRVDARKVQVIGELLSDADPVFADTVAIGAAEYAATHTGPQTRAWLMRRVIAADPTAAEHRRERATAGRRVTLTPLPDGVAELSALMPAVQARQIFDTLTAVAHSTDGVDARTLDQRRSDALHDLTTGRADPPQIHLQVTVPASTLAGAHQGPADLSGVGPITAGQLGELLHSAPGDQPESGPGAGGGTTWRRMLTDPASGVLTDLAEQRYRPSARLDRAVRARDLTCRFPGCRRSALTPRNGVDLDHTTPWPAGETTADNLACLCRHHHRVKHSPDWAVAHEPDGTLHWTTPGGRTFTTYAWQYDDPPD